METKDRTNGLPETPDRQLEWRSPGVSLRKRWLTGLGVALAAAVFIFIALSQGASMLVSTVIGIVFIGCFVWYLLAVAPPPFCITIDKDNLIRTERGAEPVVIPWIGVAKVKEELFKSGTSVSVTVYKRVGERGLHRSWVVYRDDLPGFDSLVAAMRDHMPEDSPWYREKVHD
ncbi:MAG: hypothetical protein ACLQUY_17645 [Ktedonobacterales bacterium]